MTAQEAKKSGKMLTAAIGRKRQPQRWAALIRKRLGKRLRKGDTELLTALFERMERYAKGVDADQFRVDHKDRRRDLDRLVGRLVTENYEPDRKIYRPTLIALPLIGSERALQTLGLIDRVLVYFASEFEREQDRQITLKEISETLEVPLEDVADAVGCP